MLTVIVMMAFAAAPAAGQTIEQAVQEAQARAAAAVQTINSPEFQQAIAAAEAAGALAMSQARVAAAADPAGTATGGRPRRRGRDSGQGAAEEAAREKERAQRDKERESSYYEQGQNALDSGRWDRAVSSFDRVIEMKGPKTDAALYWKAYAQNKQGLRPEALATIGILTHK